MSAHEALGHSFVNEKGPEDGNEDLLPVIKKNFNARRTLHAAIDTIRAINKLREGGAAGMMEGAKSKEPARSQVENNNTNTNNDSTMNTSANATNGANQNRNEEEDKVVGEGGDAMEIDSRGNGRGQTEEMIAAQQRKVHETTKSLWHKAAG